MFRRLAVKHPILVSFLTTVCLFMTVGHCAQKVFIGDMRYGIPFVIFSFHFFVGSILSFHLGVGYLLLCCFRGGTRRLASHGAVRWLDEERGGAEDRSA